MIIDHINAENIDLVLETDFNMGFTIQEGKLTPKEFYELFISKLESYSDRVLLNSDSGRDPSNPLAVAETANFLLKSGFSAKTITQITNKNAKRIFSV